MPEISVEYPAYVIKAAELAALNYLPANHPRPRFVEWINRGTNQRLRESTVQMLQRTIFSSSVSPSVDRLRSVAGLRASFTSDNERDLFAAAFNEARTLENETIRHLITAVFEDRKDAERAISELRAAGLPDHSISVLWRASQFMDTERAWPDGHSKLSVASAVAGGGVAGAMLGVAILAVPGIGPVAAAGAIASSAFASVAGVSAAIGATGGAIARMLTDHDVDGVSATLYEQEVQRGKIFVSVDTQIAAGRNDIVQRILVGNRGSSLVGGNDTESLELASSRG